MNRGIRSCSSIALVKVALLATAAPAIAAQQPSPETGFEGGDEVIIVTANRRAEELQDVPGSVQAFGGDALAAAQIANPEDLALLVPGLTLTNPYGEGSSPVFVMRGVAANDFSATQSRPVALYLDDALRVGSTFEAVPFFDLERVEVLKGPQGALYGRNATGGVVRILTRMPGFSTEGYLTAGYGNHDSRKLEGAVEIPVIADMLGARAAFTYARNDGYVENHFPNNPDEDQTDVFAGRLSLRFQPSDGFDGILRFNYRHSSGAAGSVYPSQINPVFTAGVTRGDLGFFEEEADTPSILQIETSGLNLAMHYKVTDSVLLTSVSAVDWGRYKIHSDEDGLPIALAKGGYDVRDAVAMFQELRLASSSDGRFNWLVGVDLSKDKLSTISVLTLLSDPRLGIVDPFWLGTGGFGVTYGNEFDQRRSGFSAFGRSELEVTPSVRLSGGVRYSRDTVRVLNYNSGFASDPGSGIVDVPLLTDISRSQSFNNWSFEAGVDWRLSQDSHVYANFKQGYRTGAINAQAFFSASEVNVVQPEKADSYEIGLKSQLFDHSLTLNLAGFYVDYRNQQVMNTDPMTTLSSLLNVDSRIYGLELGAVYKASSTVQFYANLSVLDPKYRDGSELNVSLDNEGRPIAGTGIPIAGNQTIGSARWSTNLGANATLAEFAGGKIVAHVDAIYTSRVYFTGYQDDAISMPGHWLVNGRVGFETGKFTIALWAKNVFDKHHLTYANDYRPSVGYIYGRRGPPRTFGIEAGLSF